MDKREWWKITKERNQIDLLYWAGICNYHDGIEYQVCCRAGVEGTDLYLFEWMVEMEARYGD